MPNLKRMLSNTGIMCAFLCFTQLSFANNIDYSSVDVSALQNQYQRQLKPKPVRKQVARKTVKRNQISNAELQQKAIARQRALAAQQRLAQQTTRRASATPRAVVQRTAVARPVPQTTNAPAPRRDAIFEAASVGNVNQIRQLLNRGININQANPERETALHMAAAKGHYSAVIFLLNNGANLHARTVNNWLPIHHATRFRHAQIANYLKQRGSQIYAKTSDGMSAVDMARAVNDRRILGVFGVR